MSEDSVYFVKQLNCKHEKTQRYTEKRFDVLNGLEFTFTRCLNCHKIVGLDAKRFTQG
ncbi:MAG: hypothetical protein NWE93_03085 [Candidatus Bathyarchaeota archaeon]|nr:hypothetical protein [Candidatus Bathyarchaeota archaeon]